MICSIVKTIAGVSHTGFIVADKLDKRLDIEGTYPNEELFCNISKETTRLEFSRFKGLDMNQQRMVGINLTGGTTNALEICTTVLDLPTSEQLLARFNQKRNM